MKSLFVLFFFFFYLVSITESLRIIDPIYGSIELSENLARVVSLPEFQALRRVKQTGNVEYVYPSAHHTRFEHSIGAAYLGGVFLKKLSQNQPELQINDTLIETIQLALLTHDFGHAAFSHLIDAHIQDLVPSLNITSMLHHELRSVILLGYITRNYALSFTREQIELAFHMILGMIDQRYPLWIFQIVSDVVRNLDFDKMDYLIRDAYAIGVPRSTWPDISRLLQLARVVTTSEGNQLLVYNSTSSSIGDNSLARDDSSNRDQCIDNEGETLVEELFKFRRHMYSGIYQHPTVVRADQMTIQVLRVVARYQNWHHDLTSTNHTWRFTICDFALHHIINIAKLNESDDEVTDALGVYHDLMSRRLWNNNNHPNATTMQKAHTSQVFLFGFA